MLNQWHGRPVYIGEYCSYLTERKQKEIVPLTESVQLLQRESTEEMPGNVHVCIQKAAIHNHWANHSAVPFHFCCNDILS
jgi:hypothetical protein